MEGLQPVRVVGECDRVDQAVEAIKLGADFVAEPGDLALVLHVADVNRRVVQEPRDAPADLLVLNHVDALCPGLGQHAAHVVGDALAVGHAEDDDSLAGQLQKVHEHGS